MLRTRQQRHVARPLFEQLGEAVLLLRDGLVGENPLGGVLHDAEQTDDSAAVVAHRRVAEAEVRDLRRRPALHRYRQIVRMKRDAARHLRQRRPDRVQGLGPDLVQRPAQRLRMLGAENRHVGVVVEHRQLRAPGKEHRLAAVTHEPPEREDRLRPAGDHAERRALPIEIADAHFHLAGGRGDRRGFRDGLGHRAQ